MKKIEIKGKIYSQVSFETEDEFEDEVVQNEQSIFGSHGIYIDIKKKLGKKTSVAGIPDGYYLDLKYHEKPTLYIVENELNTHDLYKHIAEQMMRFIILSKADKQTIKDVLVEELSNEKYKDRLKAFFAESKFNNIHYLLEEAVTKNDIRTIIIIDEISEQLIGLSKEFAKPIELIEFQTFTDGENRIHLFDPFDDDVDSEVVIKSGKSAKPAKEVDYDTLDTIIVPARKDGFEETFIGENCWYAVRISASMQERLSYCAAYQVKPESGINYYAKIKKIEPYIDPMGNKTNKFIIYFDGPAIKLENKIALTKENPNLAPQSCVYTSFEKLIKAKVIEDLFK